MIFIAHIEVSPPNVEPEKEYQTETERVIFFANNYGDAATKLDEYYGLDLEAITYLQPISDNDTFIYLTDKSEELIREHPFNSF